MINGLLLILLLMLFISVLVEAVVQGLKKEKKARR
jgi:Na+-transporting NADH:ubiquinone oxidoreductase subunit NqrC